MMLLRNTLAVFLLRFRWLLLMSICVVLPAQASVIACSSGTTLGHVGNAVACEKSTATQDFLNTTPMTVNSELFFGNSDWQFLKKDDPAGNGQSGSWSLTNNEWSTYANIMLIFKDGNGTTLLGFLLGTGFTSGNWTSPFTALEFPAICGNHPGCSTVKNVSHISYYARGVAPPPPGGDDPPPSVPEPSPLLLMMMGVIGLFGARHLGSKRIHPV